MCDAGSMIKNDDLLEPSDVARLLGLSTTRVRQLALEGQLPVAVRTRRGLRLFRLLDVKRYIAVVEQNRVQRQSATHRALKGPTTPSGEDSA